jgi:membrane dipeptidase
MAPRRIGKIPLIAAALLLLAVLTFFCGVPPVVAERMNRVTQPRRPVSPAAAALHARLRVADLHADSLLWGRDLLERSRQGHVDLPRLVEGRVVLQLFDVVTKTPRGQNIERNDDSTDNILLLALAQRWPLPALRSLLARALFQAGRLQDNVARSAGRLRWIKSGAELRAFLAGDEPQRGVVACLLGLEGAQALEGKLENLDVLYDAGYRVISPSHFFDTAIGGSAAGVHKAGLTALGRAWLAKMEHKKMIVDVAHASEATVDDVLALASRPIIVSHTGLRGNCKNQRNLRDDQARRIAAGGGLIGIGFWDVAVCGRDAAAVARAIVYAVRLVGVEHVALGSDFDGAIAAPFDAAGLSQLTGALLATGLSEHEIEQVMGENELRFFAAQLP